MLHDDAKVTLLLTGRFGKQEQSDAKPLSPTEWGRFAAWLHTRGASPRDLLASGAGALLDAWTDKKVTRSRIDQLLGRGVAMSLALDKWHSAGLWVMTRSDRDYPRSLKQRLREASPPVLFGCGERSLLGQGGLAIVGARDADEAALSDTEKLATTAAHDGVAVVSGGARGVDEAAMIAALDAGGVAAGVLANNLLSASTARRYRRALRDGHLVLVSPFQPEARFMAGNAMARNKYIYCLADAAVVISTANESGGTWSGAVENMKRQWVPEFVRRSPAPGHEGLVSLGAQWLPDELDSIRSLVERSSGAQTDTAAEDADWIAHSDLAKVPEPALGKGSAQAEESVEASDERNTQREQEGVEDEPQSLEATQAELFSFYELFVQHLRRQLRFDPATAKTLAERLDLPKPLVDKWLRQAVEDGIAEKKGKPVKFHLRERDESQRSLF